MLSKLLVYNTEGTRIGYGYVVMYNGRVFKPDIFSDDGEPLPTNEWYNIVFTDEQHLVVLNKTIH